MSPKHGATNASALELPTLGVLLPQHIDGRSRTLPILAFDRRVDFALNWFSIVRFVFWFAGYRWGAVLIGAVSTDLPLELGQIILVI